MTTRVRLHAGNVGAEYEAELRLQREALDAEVRAFEDWKSAAGTLGPSSPEAVRLRAEWFSKSGQRSEVSDALALVADELADALVDVECEAAHGARVAAEDLERERELRDEADARADVDGEADRHG